MKEGMFDMEIMGFAGNRTYATLLLHTIPYCHYVVTHILDILGSL